MGGTYRSARLPVRGPPATGRFHQKSAVGGRLSEKSTVGGRLRKKKGRRRGKGKKKRGEERIPRQCRPRPPAVAARGSPAIAFSPARGDGASPRARRQIEA
ncbi:hypothetical protein BHM03_00030777, partial [Ensete ventricosum]